MTEAEKTSPFYAVIAKAKTSGANLLLPSTAIAGLSEWHAPVIEEVELARNAEGHFEPDSSDVYPHDTAETYLDKDKKTQLNPKKKWRLTKQALMKLSVQAGILWSPDLCKRVDNRADRNYICYQAVGGVRKADGSPVFFKAEYDIDFELLEEELREQYEKKAQNLKKGFGRDARDATDSEKVEYVEYCVKRDMLQKRKHGLKLAESGAMNRVVREILGLKQAYTQEELMKPFVMARIVFKPDYNDKEVRSELIKAAVRQMQGIYGPQTMESAIRDAKPADVIEIGDEDPLGGDGEPEDDVPADTVYKMDKGKVFEPAPEPEPEPVDSLIADFKNCDAASQGKAIEALAKTKKYDLAAFLARSKKAQAGELSEAKRVELFTYLNGDQEKGGAKQ